MKTHEAILESITQNRIVIIETATSDDVESLKLASDDWVENGSIIEFWGRDDDGDDWRVHVERG